jgi:hypothetical protein
LRRRGLCLGAAAAAFILPLIALWTVFDVNLLAVWRWNFSNHALFYQHNPRTYWKWLLINPVELALAAGAPLASLAIVGIARSWRAASRHWGVAAFSVAWMLLWLSGKNMGEAARLWVFLLPYLVLGAAVARRSSAACGNGTPLRRSWLALLALQAAACVATATRIDGFHFRDVLHQPAASQSPGDSAAS